MSGDDDTLIRLSTPGWLLRDHAAGFERLLAACRARGVHTTGTESDQHATRSYAMQVDLWHDYMTTDYAASDKNPANSRYWNGQTWWRKPGKPAVAIPGTSNHGDGDTVDWQELGGYGSANWTAFAALATEHGWNNREGSSVGEPWHWTRVDSADAHRNDPAPTEEDEDEDMPKALITTDPRKGGLYWLLSGDLTTKRHLHSMGEVETLKAAGAVQLVDGSVSGDTIDCAAWEPCHDVLGNGAPVPGGPVDN